MRFLSSLAVAALLLAPVALSAQTATGTVSAQARVQSAVTFQAPVSNLDFGTITPNVVRTITPAAANGSGVVGVSYNTPATITVSTLTLSGPGGATITPTLSCAQAATSAAASPVGFSCATGYATTLSGNAASTWFIYIGGQIAAGASANAVAGDYTGTVTLTASFSTF